MRYERIAALKRCSLATEGTKFLSLISTPILWLAFLHVIFMCTLKLSLLSIVTPSNLILFIETETEILGVHLRDLVRGNYGLCSQTFSSGKSKSR